MDSRGNLVKREYGTKEDVIRVTIIPSPEQLFLLSKKRKTLGYITIPPCNSQVRQGLIEVLGKAIQSKA